MEIQIKCETGKTLLLEEMHEFQDDIKELTDEEYLKLRRKILKSGFSFAPHVWLNPDNKEWCILDGHQRLKTLKRMVMSDFIGCPPIPVVTVKADSFADAKDKVLQGASQYGRLRAEKLAGFMKANKISIDEAKLSFSFPEIKMKSFEVAFFPSATGQMENQSAGPGEKNPSKMVHTCPECGAKFNNDGVVE